VTCAVVNLDSERGNKIANAVGSTYLVVGSKLIPSIRVRVYIVGGHYRMHAFDVIFMEQMESTAMPGELK
jgi:hypothetical protein